MSKSCRLENRRNDGTLYPARKRKQSQCSYAENGSTGQALGFFATNKLGVIPFLRQTRMYEQRILPEALRGESVVSHMRFTAPAWSPNLSEVPLRSCATSFTASPTKATHRQQYAVQIRCVVSNCACAGMVRDLVMNAFSTGATAQNLRSFAKLAS